MDERRDPQADAGSDGRITSVAGQLSPIQQAYSDYAVHFAGCPGCRDIDRRCDKGEQLWRTYNGQGVEAFERLADEG
ncbi:hypothetical protein GCM10010099_22470 [Streptomyces cinereus]|nr:hypothetical protein GCM10010099_22470 [Streptomyces cinereus]